MKRLALLKEEIDKCVKCGTCRSICPTTRVIGREQASARGKLTLIGSYLDGGLPLSETYLKYLKECTLCGGCRDVCPAGVKTTEVFIAARADAVRKEGLPFVASFVLKNLLDSSKLMPLALRFASRVKGLVFKDSAVENGLISRFSLPLIGSGRLVPELAPTFFMDLPEVRALSGYGGKDRTPPTGSAKVAFFAGCGVNYLMPQVGTASIDAIKRAGGAIVVPSGQVCCGMPAYYTGDVETAKRLALKNIEVFESHPSDYIVTSCATCSYGLKAVFKKLLGEEGPEVLARVDAFTSKVRDITELLSNDLKFTPEARAVGKGGEPKKVVTYHDPCHLNRSQGIRAQPRALLAGVESIELREMKFPCSCCGLGGGLSFSNYELSIDIARRKAESVRDSGADIVATACPGCIVQIRDGLHRYGVDAKVVHVVELL
jgi:glycolate oxidase iron-sulfur subunit